MDQICLQLGPDNPNGTFQYEFVKYKEQRILIHLECLRRKLLIQFKKVHGAIWSSFGYGVSQIVKNSEISNTSLNHFKIIS